MKNPSLKRELGIITATLIVVANTIGTGIFTTTGFLARDLGSPVAILLAWAFGAVFALSGALAYGQLSAHMPENGGEYLLLTKLYHPAAGFLAGCVSLLVGFSAPIAAASLAFGNYFRAIFPGTNPLIVASLLVVSLSMIHALNIQLGSGIQNMITIAKVLLIIVFVGAGFMVSPNSIAFVQPQTLSLVDTTLSPAFAVGIIYIYFSYSGWNGAAYLAGEIKNPAKTLPVALFAGTLVVVSLYISLNVLFLTAVPLSSLSGVIEVGHVVAVSLFGDSVGKFFSGLISIALISSVSAMIMTGPRVYEAMGKDYQALSFLNSRLKNGGPLSATILQASVALILILTFSFDSLLTYIGFTLSIFAALTVSGVFLVRKNLKNKWRWGYPFLPFLFIALSLWIVIHSFYDRPFESLIGLVTIAGSLFLYFLLRNNNKRS